MSKRTPYDTGKRAEPRPWTAPHRESDDDYGKVDFEDDAGGTVATLYIEQEEDRTYTLKGYSNEPLKVEIVDESGGEDAEHDLVGRIGQALVEKLPWLREREGLDINDIALVLIDAGFIRGGQDKT